MIRQEMCWRVYRKPDVMSNEEIREYCLLKPSVIEGFPFNDTALFFKVAGKMFALLDHSEDSGGISYKCDLELDIEPNLNTINN